MALPLVKDLFTRTWDGYKRRLLPILQACGVSAAAVLAAVVSAVGVSVALAFIPVAGPILAALFATACGLALIPFGFFLQSAILETAMHDGMAWRQAFAHAKKDWWAFTWTGAWTSTVMVLAFGLFIIPGIILVPAARLAQYAFKADGKRGLDALIHSHAAVRGRWWAVAWRVILFGFLLGVAPQILDAAVPSYDLQAPMTLAQGVVALLQCAYAFFLAVPLTLVFGAELYKDVAKTAPSAAPAALAKSRKVWTAVAVAGFIVGTAALVGMAMVLGPVFLEYVDRMKI